MGLFTSGKKTRYAVVGIGWFAQAAVLPGFKNAAKNSELVAIVSGDGDKRHEVGEMYGVESYTYAQYDELLASGKVDAVYIVLPNALHKEYTLRAAKHKVHVLCEKPLAASAEECREMIAACEQAGVKLMTAYRLHLEHANLAAIKVAQSGDLGPLRLLQATNVQKVVQGSTRLEGDLEGGPLTDLGIYCVNAARYLFRADPVEVTAFSTGGGPRFGEVNETVTALLRFPDGQLAMLSCGFNQAKASEFKLFGTDGSLELRSAFGFTGPKVMTVELEASSKPSETTYKDTDHVGAEIVYFADCIQNDTTPEPDGYEGLADIMIVEAIKESAKSGRAVKVGPFKDKPRPEPSMVMELPPVKQPEFVEAESPMS